MTPKRVKKYPARKAACDMYRRPHPVNYKGCQTYLDLTAKYQRHNGDSPALTHQNFITTDEKLTVSANHI